jgi:hypothetical protein
MYSNASISIHEEKISPYIFVVYFTMLSAVKILARSVFGGMTIGGI